jgi:hypothetical protein
MNRPAFVNPPEEYPTEWTCAACNAVITSPDHEQNGEHVGCGGKIELRAVQTSGVTAPAPEAASLDPALAEDLITELAPAEPVETATPAPAPTPHAPARRRMPETRASRTRTFRLVQDKESIEFEFIVGFFEDGTVGEVFIHADRQGAALSGFLDAAGIMISMLLQYGVPLPKVIGKLKGMRFPPDGRVPLGAKGESVFAFSPLDLLARWLETFTTREERA